MTGHVRPKKLGRWSGGAEMAVAEGLDHRFVMFGKMGLELWI